MGGAAHSAHEVRGNADRLQELKERAIGLRRENGFSDHFVTFGAVAGGYAVFGAHEHQRGVGADAEHLFGLAFDEEIADGLRSNVCEEEKALLSRNSFETCVLPIIETKNETICGNLS